MMLVDSLTMDKAIFSLNYLNSINNLKGLSRQGFAVLNFCCSDLCLVNSSV